MWALAFNERDFMKVRTHILKRYQDLKKKGVLNFKENKDGYFEYSFAGFNGKVILVVNKNEHEHIQSKGL